MIHFARQPHFNHGTAHRFFSTASSVPLSGDQRGSPAVGALFFGAELTVVKLAVSLEEHTRNTVLGPHHQAGQ